MLVHDYFVQDGGAERCAVEFANLLPGAEIETSFFDARAFRDRIDPSRVRTWPLQRLFGPTRRFRAALPLYPLWFATRDLRRHDFVLSSSSAFAKAVRTRPNALHVSYVYTPMRFAWDLDHYLEASSYSPGTRLAARVARPLLRRWDVATASRPDVVVAISKTIQERIKRLWGRESEVIYPPVDTDEVQLSGRDDGYLLVAARLLAYRRIDLVVAAASRLGRDLIVVGEGPERRRLESMAGSGTRFLGHVDRMTLLDLFARCHAYVVPGIEDFGIAPVEAMAAGKPVIAFGAGGVTETVVEGVTGAFFRDPRWESVAQAIHRLDDTSFDPVRIRAQAQTFSADVFRARWRELLARLGVDPRLYSAP